MAELSFTGVSMLAASLLCFFSAALLLKFRPDSGGTRRFLTWYYCVLGLGMGIAFIVESGIVLRFPHFYRVAMISAYLYPALAYLYVKSHVNPNFGKRNWLLFLPALFYVVDYLPFFLMPYDKKISYIQFALSHRDLLMSHAEGWLTPPWFHLVLRNVVSLFYWVLSMLILRKVDHVGNNAFFADNKPALTWLKLFTWLQVLFFAPYMIVAALGLYQYTFYTNILPIAFTATLTSLLLFIRPGIFQGFSGVLLALEKPTSAPGTTTHAEPDLQFEPVPGKTNRMRLVKELETLTAGENGEIEATEQLDPLLLSGNIELEYLSQQRILDTEKRIEEFLETRKPFLDAQFSHQQFANELQMTPRQMTAFLHTTRQLSYEEFIDKCRIEYCVQQLVSGHWPDITLEAIAGDCGFESRELFVQAFRRFYGVAPSLFIGQLKSPGKSVTR